MAVETRKRAYVETYGCQMNVSDGELMEAILADEGYEIVSAPEDADVVLVNTCAIREHAETRVLGRVSQLNGLKREKPDLIIGVTGCGFRVNLLRPQPTKSREHLFGDYLVQQGVHLIDQVHGCIIAQEVRFRLCRQQIANMESLCRRNSLFKKASLYFIPGTGHQHIGHGIFFRILEIRECL